MFVSPTVLTVGANLFFIQAVAPLLILLLAIIREVTKFNNVHKDKTFALFEKVLS